MDIGYAAMLQSLGPNVKSFLENLDTVHTLLAVSYSGIIPPMFRAESCDDGNIILHYYSVRDNLELLVKGLIIGAADLLYKTKVDVTIEETGRHHTETKSYFHAALKVFMPSHLRCLSATPSGYNVRLRCPSASSTLPGQKLSPNGCPFSGVMSPTNRGLERDSSPLNNNKPSVINPNRNSKTENQNSNLVTNGISLDLSGEILTSHDCPDVDVSQLCKFFPYHIIFDKNLTIKQCGETLNRMCKDLTPGVALNQVTKLKYPKIPLDFDSIVKFIKSSFTIELTGKTTFTGLRIKGQMFPIGTDHLIMLGAPKVTTLNELINKKVFLDDFQVFDMTREFVLLNQLRQAEIDISLQLEQTTAKLQLTSEALQSEKEKTDMLLHSMLPVKVADQLRDGKTVEAEKFEESTILFSDIVSFTTIASAVAPIDIVAMLNSLYSKFDRLTEIHDVYKVETIGDAYMVVGGVPEKTSDHAQRVADFALGMVRECGAVLSPKDNKPIQVRVGIHTGSVVAGVVGNKMPRFCLFGDTVNTAARMEHFGVQGKIHISSDTYSQLKADDSYMIQERGEIDVKGKGLMVTYFIEGHKRAKFSNEECLHVYTRRESSCRNNGACESKCSCRTEANPNPSPGDLCRETGDDTSELGSKSSTLRAEYEQEKYGAESAANTKDKAPFGANSLVCVIL